MGPVPSLRCPPVPLGDTPGLRAIELTMVEVVGHGWDLGQALGQEIDVDEDVLIPEVRRSLTGREDTVRFVFGEHRLDLARVELTCRGVPVPVQPQVFDVLRYLIEHCDRVVGKDELLDNVWGDRFVSESALTSRVKAARRAVGDDGTRQSVIRTVHGRGYQFVAAVRRDDTVTDPLATPTFGSDLPLPRALSSFIGRDHDTTALIAMLDERRLVTICGPGGVGKTRLAHEVALRIGPAYPDGVHLLELGSLEPEADVLEHVASELGVKERVGTSTLERVVESLAMRQVLLVVDNCEHVAASVSSFVLALARRTHGLDVLATSRRPLGVDGEQLWRLAPLPLVGKEGEDAPAVVLLRDRLRSVLPDMPTDADASAHIVDICRELDGVPLLLELAAARARHIGLRGVRDSLADPTILDRPTSRSTPRHRSLEAMIAWSFDRLGEHDRQAFLAMSVFASWFGIDGAAAVADVDEVRGSLWTLVDESLVVADLAGPRPRYRLLVPLRSFGRNRLERSGCAAEVRLRHADHAITAVTNADRDLRGPDGGPSMRELASLLPEIRIAHRTLAESGRATDIGRLLGPLFVFAQEHVRGDVFTMIQDAVAQATEPARGVLLAACTVAAWQRGDLATARELGQRAVRATGSGLDGRFAHLAFGQVCELDGELRRADEHAQEAVRLGRGRGGPTRRDVGPGHASADERARR